MTEPTPRELDNPETFNPWSVVNLVFAHLAERGLHPVLGETGDPSAPAAELLRAMGIRPGQDSAGPGATLIQDELAKVRARLDPNWFPDVDPD